MTDPHSSVVLADQLIGMVVGGYRIETLLGQGGMGLVYQARHELIDRRFGLVQVVVYVAGGAVGSIPGLLPEEAEALRSALLTGRGEDV